MKVLIMGSPTTNGYLAFGKKRGISGGGWVENLVERLSNMTSIQLFVCFYDDADTFQARQYRGVTYFALPIRVKALTACNQEMIEDLRQMMKEVRPDLVHIIGTEREHDFRLLELAGADSAVFSITGLVSFCAKHYYAGIEEYAFRKKSLGDYLRNGGPIKEKKRFETYGKFEERSLKKAKYVMGRTTWDYACVKQINPNIEYIYCSEILNPIFQTHKWDIRQATRHRIFLSQATYPLKGLHKLLEAFPTVLRFYPDSEIVIAGANILADDTLEQKIKRTTYAEYLLKLIKKLKIPRDKVRYIGMLNAEGMLEQYLAAHVFVLPSAIENSPNSLGEAMSLGMPCISACVGGVQDMVRDRIDGFLYPFDESYMLAHYICEVFKDDHLSETMGCAARESAEKRFDADEVIRTTIRTYEKILSDKRNL